jgi:hypothetical protein
VETVHSPRVKIEEGRREMQEEVKAESKMTRERICRRLEEMLGRCRIVEVHIKVH